MSETNKVVRWTKIERDLVAQKAADLMVNHGITAYGRAAIEAQNVLTPERRRIESSLLMNAKHSLGDIIDAFALQLRINHRLKKEPAEPVKAPAETEVAPAVAPQIMIQNATESFMDMAIESFADAFRKKLRSAMLNVVAEVMDEASHSITLPTLPAKSQEVSAINAGQAAEVKAHKIKVAIVGGTEVGGDKQKIENGLKDVYDFRYIESKNQAVRAEHCDLVLVRTSFTDHCLEESVTRLVGKDRMKHVHRRSPNAVNEWLLDHYTKSAAH